MTRETPRRKARGLRGAIYGTALWLGFLYLLAHTIAVRVFGWAQLREWLGQDAYNALIPAGGVGTLLTWFARLLALDATLGLLRGCVRWPLRRVLPRLAPARQGLLLHAGSVLLLGLGVLTWPLLVTSSLGDHVTSLTLRLAMGGARAEDTVYAPGFSEWRFRRCEQGMSRADVEALLGPPLGVLPWAPEVARYSHSPADTHYWRRWVVYDAEDRVARTVGDFYFD